MVIVFINTFDYFIYLSARNIFFTIRKMDFIAIDFETATASRASICEAGICIVENGMIKETKSWLVRPTENRYDYWNIRIHGIRPQDTVNAPEFPHIWNKIAERLRKSPTLIAHNAAFDIGCIRSSLELYKLEKPDVDYFCSLRFARRLYDFKCNKLDYLCNQFGIAYGTHHRAGDDAAMCAKLFLRELHDSYLKGHDILGECGGKL